ncbi:transporter [Escherichia coli]|nr:transporter [Escherichia coli]
MSGMFFPDVMFLWLLFFFLFFPFLSCLWLSRASPRRGGLS